MQGREERCHMDRVLREVDGFGSRVSKRRPSGPAPGNNLCFSGCCV